MSTASDLAAAVANLIDAIQGISTAPGDQVDALLSVAGIDGAGAVASGTRRLAAIALAGAAARYAPASFDDALSLTNKIATLFDLEITVAGDAGQDDTFVALGLLRAAVISDLMARGASLAPLVTVTMPETLPAVVVAQRLYGDASRADELIARVDPIHPLFMPTTMLVLGRRWPNPSPSPRSR